MKILVRDSRAVLAWAVVAVAVATSCRKNHFVDVPGWRCAWNKDSCTCMRADAPRTLSAEGTHPSCDPDRAYGYCVGGSDMRNGTSCTCHEGPDPGIKPSEEIWRESQCPPLPAKR